MLRPFYLVSKFLFFELSLFRGNSDWELGLLRLNHKVCLSYIEYVEEILVSLCIHAATVIHRLRAAMLPLFTHQLRAAMLLLPLFIHPLITHNLANSPKPIEKNIFMLSLLGQQHILSQLLVILLACNTIFIRILLISYQKNQILNISCNFK